MKTFQRPDGHEKHCTSSTIAEDLSFGYGHLDDNGYWQYGCYECARAHEKQFPKDGNCWPYSLKTLRIRKIRRNISVIKKILFNKNVKLDFCFRKLFYFTLKNWYGIRSGYLWKGEREIDGRHVMGWNYFIDFGAITLGVWSRYELY